MSICKTERCGSMGKKLLIVAIAVVGVALVLKNTDLGSHAKLWWKNTKSDVKKEVPLEWEIDRLRMEISSLSCEEKKHINVMAEEYVGIQNLERDIERMKESLAAQWKRIDVMTADLKKGEQYITYGGERYSADRVKTMLKHDFNAAKDGEKGLETKQKMLEERRTAYEQAKADLYAMRHTQRELETQLATLEAEVKALRVAQTRSKYNYDDSKLSKTKEGVENLKTRVAVEKKKLDLQAEFNPVAPVLDKQPEQKKDILQEIDDYKNNANKGAEKVQK